jgi:Cu/Ag efflux protein CusF
LESGPIAQGCIAADAAGEEEDMKLISRVILPLVAAGAVAVPAVAQNVVEERANITAVDWRAMQVELKDPKGRVQTWKVARDAVVRFNDKADQFPNPKLSDLRPPMYVHFTYDGDTKVINRFEVAEVGYDPSKGAPGTMELTGVITNLDANIGHVEVDVGAGPQTFEVEPKDQLKSFKRGDRITITLEKRQTNREVVTRITRRDR